MISVNNLSVQFGGTSLFSHISFIINDRDRIGLVGKNGAGKSTLLKIIKGLQIPDEGEVVVPDGCTIGYLPQEMALGSKLSVFNEALNAFSEINTLKEKIERLQGEIKKRTDYDSPEYQRMLRSHADAIERFHLLEGHSIHGDVEKILLGLGFTSDEFSRPVHSFSSGWQMRVEIAKILLQEPDLILLDEPTNHLDIESIQWLEEFMGQFKGAVILVSHDRAFLDNVTKRTVEISLGKLFDYKANYSGYVGLREERLESQMAAFNNQQRQIRQIERFVERFRYKATKARQVQSRIKMLEKIEDIELDIFDDSAISFHFPLAPHSGNIVLEAHELSKSYPQKQVLHGLDFSVINKDRIAFIGKNGEGKTTLSKIIARKLDYQGDLKYGQNIVLGYYAQDQFDLLNPERTVFQTIDDIASGEIRPRIKTLLGGFLFSGDDIEKKVKVLSGGEKSRLSLARLILTPSNLLILDEPTNHLDMRSKDILKNALIHYDGTLIIVSHDRDFLQGLTNRIFEFRDGKIHEYLGDIYDFMESKKIHSLDQLQTPSDKRRKEDKEGVSANKLNRERKKEHERELRKIRTQIARCENDIEQLEAEVKKKEEILMYPEKFPEMIRSGHLYKEYDDLKKELNKTMEDWAEWNEKLELLSNKFSDGSDNTGNTLPVQ
ncbi:MAG: ABC-F family ATP-binding cassette domain-containing protein [Bacteroidota bacterium]|nr:ABC-F family ATP-binding cassette domain-containing protein [Bacteroidota bacterium]